MLINLVCLKLCYDAINTLDYKQTDWNCYWNKDNYQLYIYGWNNKFVKNVKISGDPPLPFRAQGVRRPKNGEKWKFAILLLSNFNFFFTF